MKIKLIDYGYTHVPKRAHDNDAGLDVYAKEHTVIYSGQTRKIPLGFGLELPDGYAGFIYPRSGLCAKGITCELPPIDSGYRGEVHAIISNTSGNYYSIDEGDRIAQLVIVPCVIADLVTEMGAERGVGAFGSTGK